jgi:hypothetical protein
MVMTAQTGSSLVVPSLDNQQRGPEKQERKNAS